MFRTKFDENENLWKGLNTPSLFNPDLSLGQVALRTLKMGGSKCAQVSHDNGLRISFNEMYTKTVRAAQNIQNLGYQSRDVFAFITSNDHHLAPIVFASFCLNCPTIALDPSLGKNEIIHMLNITKPRLMFCGVEVYELVSECLKQLGNDAKIYTFGGEAGTSEPVETLFTPTGSEEQFVPTSVDTKNEVAVIVCSSGTTGNAKGVTISHAAFLDQIYQYSLLLQSDDVLFGYSTLHWLTGWIAFLAGTFLGATRIITKQKASPELQLRLIEQHKITHIFNGTHHMILLVKCKALEKANLSSVRCYATGGSKIPYELAARLDSLLPNGFVCCLYGMSEAAGCVALQSKFAPSLGQLVNGSTAKVIDDNGSRCGVGIDGEICFKLKYKFLGYYGNQTATNELFDSEGFIMTGDLGHFDENGVLHLVDRKKELLKYSNYHIAPSEIETFLMEVPNVKSVCIVGLPDPEDVGDLLAAVIVRYDNLQTTEQEISNIVAENFVAYKHLRGGVYFVDDSSLPRTVSGKIQRRFVKDMAHQMYNNQQSAVRAM